MLESLDLASVFNVTMHVPALHKMLDEVSTVVTLLKVEFASAKEKQEVLEVLPKYIGKPCYFLFFLFVFVVPPPSETWKMGCFLVSQNN